MQECCTCGSVRGALGNQRPYRDIFPAQIRHVELNPSSDDYRVADYPSEGGLECRSTAVLCEQRDLPHRNHAQLAEDHFSPKSPDLRRRCPSNFYACRPHKHFRSESGLCCYTVVAIMSTPLATAASFFV